METDKRQRTIYLLKYTDEAGRVRQVWYSTRRQAETAAKDLKCTFVIAAARV